MTITKKIESVQTVEIETPAAFKGAFRRFLVYEDRVISFDKHMVYYYEKDGCKWSYDGILNDALDAEPADYEATRHEYLNTLAHLKRLANPVNQPIKL